MLVRLYEAEGRTPELLASDLQAVAAKQEEEALELAQEYRKRQFEKFQDLTRLHLLVLQQFAEKEGDLMTVSPWYLADALQFFARAPLVIELFPEVGFQFRLMETEISASLGQAREYLASSTNTPKVPWMEEQKGICLQAANHADLQLTRFWRGGAPQTSPAEAEGEATSGLGGDRR